MLCDSLAVRWGRWPECGLFAKGDPKLGVYRSCGWLRVYQLTITKMVEGGTERDCSMRRVTPKPIPPNHPGSYKETDCLMGVLATSMEDRDCDTVT